MNNYTDIIGILDTINKESIVPIYVPSQKKEVPFIKVTTGQQKQFLKATIDNPVFQTRFIIAAHALIQENCTDKSILKTLTTFDSAAILVQLRMCTYGNKYEVTVDGKEYSVKLDSIVNNFKSASVPADEVVIDGPFSITIGAPLFDDQYNLEKQVREKDLTDAQSLNANIGDTIGDAFIGEVSKYIKSIVIEVNATSHDVGYQALLFAKKHTVLEKLPTAVVKSVINHIEKLTTLQKSTLTTVGTDIAAQVKDVEVTLNSALFAIG